MNASAAAAAGQSGCLRPSRTIHELPRGQGVIGMRFQPRIINRRDLRQRGQIAGRGERRISGLR